MHGMIFGAMTESFCAEQSARMTAMDSATKSAKDMIHDLELEYNRSRQVPSPRRSPRSSAARRRYRITSKPLRQCFALPPLLAGEARKLPRRLGSPIRGAGTKCLRGSIHK